MRYGPLSDQKRAKSGYGLRLTDIIEKYAGAYAGSREKEGAPGIWNSLPESCRKNAVFYTDFWQAYKEIGSPQGAAAKFGAIFSL